jgi:hypothetical protein
LSVEVRAATLPALETAIIHRAVEVTPPPEPADIFHVPKLILA